MKWNENIKSNKEMFKVSDQYFDKLHAQITNDSPRATAKKVSLYNKVILTSASVAASVLLVLTVVMNFPEKTNTTDSYSNYAFQTQLSGDDLYQIMLEDEDLQPSSDELIEYAALNY